VKIKYLSTIILW